MSISGLGWPSFVAFSLLKVSTSAALLNTQLRIGCQLLFEHSPGRGNPNFTGDYTAFDALIRYADSQGRNGFVAFEIKYSESMREPMPELKPRHAELSDASGLYVDPAAAALRTSPLSQIWREHLLAQTMIDQELYDEGSLVVIAPALNYHVQDAAEAYQAQLREPEDGPRNFPLRWSPHSSLHRTRLFARATPVFAGDQVDGHQAPVIDAPPATVISPIEQAEAKSTFADLKLRLLRVFSKRTGSPVVAYPPASGSALS
jgi:hypothetical protein